MENHPGQPTKYKPEYCEQAEKLCLLGVTDAELGKFFDVDERTINNWKIAFPEFFQSIKAGREDADANVARSLYHRALGYSHPEDQIFQYQGTPVVVPTVKHYPPDTAAAFIWLKNRRSHVWRDKVEVENRIVDQSVVIRGEGKPVEELAIKRQEIKQGSVA